MPSVTTIHDANALLVFSVGPVLCCAPTLTVEAVIMPPQIHKTPGSNRDHPGVFRYSSGMVSVVDLRQRFGVSEELWQAPGRIIVTEIAGGHAGFLVDSIIDVMLWPEKGWGVTPALVPREIFKRTLMLNSKIHLYADFDQLFHFRESGYLRAHIASLIEKQKISTADVPSTASYNTSSPDQINKTIDPPQLTANARLESAVEMAVVPASVRGSNKTLDEVLAAASDHSSGSLPVAKPVDQVKLADKTRHEHAASPLPANAYKKKLAMGENPQQEKIITRSATTTSAKQPPVLVEPGSIKKTDVNEQSPFEQPLSVANIQPSDPVNDSSGKWFIIGFLVLALMAIVLLVTSFGNSGSDSKLIAADNVVEKTDNSMEVASAENVNSGYQANITKDADGIVITVDEMVSDVMRQESLPAVEIEAGNIVEKAPVPTLDPVAANKVIIHIVKKGDTLWDIASYYVRDPWRYPELAKLSNIKNPHRIYPGNKVKIVIRPATKSLNR